MESGKRQYVRKLEDKVLGGHMVRVRVRQHLSAGIEQTHPLNTARMGMREQAEVDFSKLSIF